MLRNILAIFGLISLIVMIGAAVKIQPVVERLKTFDEKSMEIYIDFAKNFIIRARLLMP